MFVWVCHHHSVYSLKTTMLMLSFLLLACLLNLSIANNCDLSRLTFIDDFPIPEKSSCPLTEEELHCNNVGQTCNGSCITKWLFFNSHTMQDFVVANVQQLQFLSDKQAFADATNEFLYLCDTGFEGLGVNDCVRTFLGLCASTNQVTSCFNQLYLFCVPLTPKCRAAVEYIIEEGLDDQCEALDCNSLLREILENPLQFTSINRIAALLHGQSRKPRKASTLYKHMTLVLETFEEDVHNVSELVDVVDAEVFLKTMDNAFSENHISNLSLLLSSETGPKVLTQLRQLNEVFGMAILSDGGRVKSNLTFTGSNLDVSFQVTDKENFYFQHYSDNSETSVEIALPREALCPIMVNDEEAPRIPIPPSSISSEDDIPDIYFDCFPPPFPSNSCRYVLMSSYAQNIEDSFEEVSNRTLLSPIVSVQVSSGKTMSHNDTFELFDRISLTFNISCTKINYTLGEKPLCHYWDILLQNWSTDGMTTVRLSHSQVLCTSNHLTSFAVLVDHTGVIETVSDGEALALSIVGYVGPVISIIALIVTLLLLILLRKQLQKGPLLYVHINLSLALLLALLIFVLGIDLPKSITWLCSVVAGLLHYLFLCVFCWSLAEGIMLYILIVKVYGSLADKWYLLLPLGWGIPIIVVGISAGINYDLYGTENYCWLSFNEGMLWSFVGPMICIVLINCIFLAFTVYHIIHVRVAGGAEQSLKKTDLAKSAIKGIIVLLPLLSVTWIIGIFTVNQQTTVFLWLFTLLNTIQGVGILYLHVLRNQFIIDWIKRKFIREKKQFLVIKEVYMEDINKRPSESSMASAITYA